MIQYVLAGRSGSCTADSDSMSSHPACRASPVSADGKSSLNWMFSRLSLSRFMSYLPLLSFGPSITVPGSAYLLSPPFGMECLTSLADDMTHYDFCPAVRPPHGALSRRSDTEQTCRVGEDVAILTPHRTGCAEFQLPVPHGRASLTAVYRWMIRGAGRGSRFKRSIYRSHGNRLPRRDSHFCQILRT